MNHVSSMFYVFLSTFERFLLLLLERFYLW